MFEKFCDYMYYLLTSPFKKIKKSKNQWYKLFKVLGEYFDDGMESIEKAREQTMLATCDVEMLPVHAADRKLTKYTGEEDENFRSRIANYTEVCRLGGTDPGLILTVKALGYPNPEKIMANVLNGRVYYETDGSWILDGSRNLEAGELEDRWAEFYIVNNMSVDDEHPVSTAILKKEVRRVKEVGAKDNYLFRYSLAVHEPHSTGSRVDYWWRIFYWSYRKTDGHWNTDGQYMLDSSISNYPVKIGFRYKGFLNFPHESGNVKGSYIVQIEEQEEQVTKSEEYSLPTFFYEYKKTDGTWMLDGSVLMNTDRTDFKRKDAFRASVTHEESIKEVRWHNQHNLFYLDGSWLTDGSKIVDAYEHTIIIGFDLHYLDGTWTLDGKIFLDGIENQEVA